MSHDISYHTLILTAVLYLVRHKLSPTDWSLAHYRTEYSNLMRHLIARLTAVVWFAGATCSRLASATPPRPAVLPPFHVAQPAKSRKPSKAKTPRYAADTPPGFGVIALFVVPITAVVRVVLDALVAAVVTAAVSVADFLLAVILGDLVMGLFVLVLDSCSSP